MSGIDINVAHQLAENTPPVVLNHFSRNIGEMNPFHHPTEVLPSMPVTSPHTMTPFGPILPTQLSVAPVVVSLPPVASPTPSRPPMSIFQLQATPLRVMQSPPVYRPSPGVSELSVPRPYFAPPPPIETNPSPPMTPPFPVNPPVERHDGVNARAEQRKRELEEMQRKVIDTKLAYEQFAARVVSPVTVKADFVEPPTIVASPTRRSLGRVKDATNLAELRRKAALKTEERLIIASSPPPKQNLADQTSPGRGTLHLTGALNAATASPGRPTNVASPTIVRPSPPSLGHNLQASSHGVVSGVFVSYPRRNSAANEEVHVDFGAVPITKEGKKLEPDEYLRLRQNLLEHSEQHTVSK
jgi:hypothetical protein